jgi:TPR repeat protein
LATRRGSNAQGQYNLALAYKDGAGVAQDPGQAIQWCRAAAEQGFARAAFALGISYRDGYVVNPDPVEALAWLSVAAARAPEHDRAEYVTARDTVTALLSRAQVAASRQRANALLVSISGTPRPPRP